MRLLLDTHALLWMVGDDERLSGSARARITGAEELAWSVVSLWEIGLKLSLRRMDFRLRAGWERLIGEEMRRNGIVRIDLQPSHCGAVAKLPWHHRDPFDRMLVAQAGIEKWALLSRDAQLDGYGVERVW